MTISVLVTGMGSATAISVVKALRQQSEIDIRIIGTDTNQKNEIAGSIFCQKFYTVPQAIDVNYYISELVNICDTEKIKIIFPIVDCELEIIARYRKAFQDKGIHIWLSDLSTILICNNKYKSYRFLSKKKFCTPKTWMPKQLTQIEKDFVYPLIVKPIDGRGSINVVYVENHQVLLEALGKVKNPIIQQYIEGKEFTIDVVADDCSHVLAVVPRERIEIKAGISYKGRTVNNKKLSEQSRKIAQELKIRGPCNLQCKIVGEYPFFFDINPRFSGGLPLTIASGVNIPLLLVKLTLGHQINNSDLNFKKDVYMARYLEEVFY
ncbi:ATP-grasp domain-containing protein [Coleofasciculus sp. E1-EBD-02]|uniref:ATP-grasp domain-containing protein n=1 Tax=Coleofasciculus sp. E1-EBD-02 TaxID=3068481 RepID=UPI0032FADDD3